MTEVHRMLTHSVFDFLINVEMPIPSQARLGLARRGYGTLDLARPALARLPLAKPGLAWPSQSWPHLARTGMARPSLA